MPRVDRMSLAQLDKLQSQIDRRRSELNATRIEAARKKITAFVESSGLSLEEVFGGYRRGRNTKGAARTKSRKPAKYRNPKNPEQTWSGRGRRPKWYMDAEKAGVDPTKLLIRTAAKA